MKTDLEKAKMLLSKNEYTCVLCKDNKTYTCTERGIKPLITWINDGTDFSGFCAADRIVGKAAALLYVVLGVKAVYAPVMSEEGISTLLRNGIEPIFDVSTKEIRNRMNNGICPMEETVRNITDPGEALYALKQKVGEMTAALA